MRASSCTGVLDPMAELNPQLGRELLVLEKSASFCRALICLRPDVKERYGGLLRESPLSLHTESQGQQLLGLFHVDELVPFEPAHLRGVEKLIAEDALGVLAPDGVASHGSGGTGAGNDGESN